MLYYLMLLVKYMTTLPRKNQKVSFPFYSNHLFLSMDIIGNNLEGDV